LTGECVGVFETVVECGVPRFLEQNNELEKMIPELSKKANPGGRR
jgi:hypothetical protein